MFGFHRTRDDPPAARFPEVAHQFLTPGRHYRVIREFRDYDGGDHPVGETWLFKGASFLPYEDGLSLFISPDGTQIRQVRMQWRPETQGSILSALSEFLEETPPG